MAVQLNIINIWQDSHSYLHNFKWQLQKTFNAWVFCLVEDSGRVVFSSSYLISIFVVGYDAETTKRPPLRNTKIVTFRLRN